MKKVIILLFIGLLFSCEKSEEPTIDLNKGTVVFWTSEFSKDNASCMGWFLWVDGVKIGVIKKPYNISTTDQIPDCGNPDFTKLSLIKGRHSYYMTLLLPTQSPPNYFVSQTYSFDITAGGCTVVRCIQ